MLVVTTMMYGNFVNLTTSAYVISDTRNSITQGR